jgi:hypothetical protein
MIPYNKLESAIRTDVNNIKNEEYKKNILRFNQLAGIIDSETELDEKAMILELINGGVAEVLAMKDLYQYARGIQGISDVARNNSFARFLSTTYTALSYKYRELYAKSTKIEFIVNALMEITLNADNKDTLCLAYGAAENVLEYDKLNYMEDVLRFLESLNRHVDKYLLVNYKAIGFNMISSSVNIIRGLRKETE